VITCWLCGEDTPFGWGVPTYNGDLVSDEFPLEPQGNRPVCEACHGRHGRGEVKTWDHHYTGRPPLGVPLTDGGGI
jgi:hypothetical protein